MDGMDGTDGMDGMVGMNRTHGMSERVGWVEFVFFAATKQTQHLTESGMLSSSFVSLSFSWTLAGVPAAPHTDALSWGRSFQLKGREISACVLLWIP